MALLHGCSKPFGNFADGQTGLEQVRLRQANRRTHKQQTKPTNMIVPFKVLDYTERQFPAQAGKPARTMKTVDLFDASEGSKCKTVMQMILSDEDSDLTRAQLEGHEIEVAIREIQPGYKGKGIEIRGHVVRESR